MKEDREVGIRELKDNLSAHLRDVKRGHPVLVMERGRPVARLVPFQDRAHLTIRKASRDVRAVKLPRERWKQLDVARALDEVRADRT